MANKDFELQILLAERNRRKYLKQMQDVQKLTDKELDELIDAKEAEQKAAEEAAEKAKKAGKEQGE